ncbi:hypothetical protein [Mycobacterium intracellulare]|uniref:Uncharacterized protein n=1 Tax=Mycobacterium intracellulare 1956 TaxID=1299331 RepID=X8CPI3_MYCIT|nr:hypothetical protein [Mycobacterium intracellulare]EUA25394.1 hypothetical protein I548_3480 [Mycobacterium intracellulare]EUA57368.1 hypothetical protein I550_0493 [Mycobacterium intracellulare 1956]MCA2355810.1 hypothetical protein [Mycobacterium intracellulare]MCA2365942.1 hypothetical protein [Mycobacterium intracellulare]
MKYSKAASLSPFLIEGAGTESESCRHRSVADSGWLRPRFIGLLGGAATVREK